MAEAATLPARKRAVPAARPKRAAAPRVRRAAPVVVDEPATPNYALRMMDALEEEHDQPVARVAAEDTFSASLSRALEAINAHAAQTEIEQPAPAKRTNWLEALDKLPPIKLPVGPAIPWRLGLPLLAALVIVMGVMSRSAGQSDPGVQLPAQQTYPVQQEAPLFANATPVATPATQDQAAPTASQQLGVSDNAAMNFDLVGIGIKLLAVLGLAYGSMLLLKRIGFGGAQPSSSAAGNAMQVVSSIALAPNRSIHVIRVPGGKALLVGATPNAVNLLADLGDLGEDQSPEAASFLDAFKTRLSANS